MILQFECYTRPGIREVIFFDTVKWEWIESTHFPRIANIPNLSDWLITPETDALESTIVLLMYEFGWSEPE